MKLRRLLQQQFNILLRANVHYLSTQLDLSSVLYVHIRRLKLTLSAAYKYELVADITPAAYASLSTEYWTISGSKLKAISECCDLYVDADGAPTMRIAFIRFD